MFTSFIIGAPRSASDRRRKICDKSSKICDKSRKASHSLEASHRNRNRDSYYSDRGSKKRRSHDQYRRPRFNNGWEKPYWSKTARKSSYQDPNLVHLIDCMEETELLGDHNFYKDKMNNDEHHGPGQFRPRGRGRGRGGRGRGSYQHQNQHYNQYHNQHQAQYDNGYHNVHQGDLRYKISPKKARISRSPQRDYDTRNQDYEYYRNRNPSPPRRRRASRTPEKRRRSLTPERRRSSYRNENYKPSNAKYARMSKSTNRQQSLKHDRSREGRRRSRSRSSSSASSAAQSYDTDSSSRSHSQQRESSRSRADRKFRERNTSSKCSSWKRNEEKYERRRQDDSESENRTPPPRNKHNEKRPTWPNKSNPSRYVWINPDLKSGLSQNEVHYSDNISVDFEEKSDGTIDVKNDIREPYPEGEKQSAKQEIEAENVEKSPSLDFPNKRDCNTETEMQSAKQEAKQVVDWKKSEERPSLEITKMINSNTDTEKQSAKQDIDSNKSIKTPSFEVIKKRNWNTEPEKQSKRQAKEALSYNNKKLDVMTNVSSKQINQNSTQESLDDEMDKSIEEKSSWKNEMKEQMLEKLGRSKQVSKHKDIKACQNEQSDVSKQDPKHKEKETGQTEQTDASSDQINFHSGTVDSQPLKTSSNNNITYSSAGGDEQSKPSYDELSKCLKTFQQQVPAMSEFTSTVLGTLGNWAEKKGKKKDNKTYSKSPLHEAEQSKMETVQNENLKDKSYKKYGHNISTDSVIKQAKTPNANSQNKVDEDNTSSKIIPQDNGVNDPALEGQLKLDKLEKKSKHVGRSKNEMLQNENSIEKCDRKEVLKSESDDLSKKDKVTKAIPQNEIRDNKPSTKSSSSKNLVNCKTMENPTAQEPEERSRKSSNEKKSRIGSISEKQRMENETQKDKTDRTVGQKSNNVHKVHKKINIEIKKTDKFNIEKENCHKDSDAPTVQKSNGRKENLWKNAQFIQLGAKQSQSKDMKKDMVKENRQKPSSSPSKLKSLKKGKLARRIPYGTSTSRMENKQELICEKNKKEKSSTTETLDNSTQELSTIEATSSQIKKDSPNPNFKTNISIPAKEKSSIREVLEKVNDQKISVQKTNDDTRKELSTLDYKSDQVKRDIVKHKQHTKSNISFLTKENSNNTEVLESDTFENCANLEAVQKKKDNSEATQKKQVAAATHANLPACPPSYQSKKQRRLSSSGQSNSEKNTPNKSNEIALPKTNNENKSKPISMNIFERFSKAVNPLSQNENLLKQQNSIPERENKLNNEQEETPSETDCINKTESNNEIIERATSEKKKEEVLKGDEDGISKEVNDNEVENCNEDSENQTVDDTSKARNNLEANKIDKANIDDDGIPKEDIDDDDIEMIDLNLPTPASPEDQAGVPDSFEQTVDQTAQNVVPQSPMSPEYMPMTPAPPGLRKITAEMPPSQKVFDQRSSQIKDSKSKEEVLQNYEDLHLKHVNSTEQPKQSDTNKTGHSKFCDDEIFYESGEKDIKEKDIENVEKTDVQSGPNTPSKRKLLERTPHKRFGKRLDDASKQLDDLVDEPNEKNNVDTPQTPPGQEPTKEPQKDGKKKDGESNKNSLNDWIKKAKLNVKTPKKAKASSKQDAPNPSDQDATSKVDDHSNQLESEKSNDVTNEDETVTTVTLIPDKEVLSTSAFLKGFELCHTKVLRDDYPVYTQAHLNPKKLYYESGRCLLCRTCSTYFTPLAFTVHHDESKVLDKLDQEKSMNNGFSPKDMRIEIWNQSAGAIFEDFQHFFTAEKSKKKIRGLQPRTPSALDRKIEAQKTKKAEENNNVVTPTHAKQDIRSETEADKHLPDKDNTLETAPVSPVPLSVTETQTIPKHVDATTAKPGSKHQPRLESLTDEEEEMPVLRKEVSDSEPEKISGSEWQPSFPTIGSSGKMRKERSKSGPAMIVPDQGLQAAGRRSLELLESMAREKRRDEMTPNVTIPPQFHQHYVPLAAQPPYIANRFHEQQSRPPVNRSLHRQPEFQQQNRTSSPLSSFPRPDFPMTSSEIIERSDFPRTTTELSDFPVTTAELNERAKVSGRRLSQPQGSSRDTEGLMRVGEAVPLEASFTSTDSLPVRKQTGAGAYQTHPAEQPTVSGSQPMPSTQTMADQQRTGNQEEGLNTELLSLAAGPHFGIRCSDDGTSLFLLGRMIQLRAMKIMDEKMKKKLKERQEMNK